MNTPAKPTPLLDSRETMLETLHMAYRFALDHSYLMGTARNQGRMHPDEEEGMGRRLAEYWQIKNLSNPTS